MYSVQDLENLSEKNKELMLFDGNFD